MTFTTYQIRTFRSSVPILPFLDTSGSGLPPLCRPYVIYNFVKYAVEPGRQLRDYKLWRGRNVMPRLDQSPKVWYFGEFRPDQGYEIEDSESRYFP